jgi:hypothetical protein
MCQNAAGWLPQGHSVFGEEIQNERIVGIRFEIMLLEGFQLRGKDAPMRLLEKPKSNVVANLLKKR